MVGLVLGFEEGGWVVPLGCELDVGAELGDTDRPLGFALVVGNEGDCVVPLGC